MDDLSEDADEMRSLELEGIDDLFQDDLYPITTEELIEKHGDREVEYPGGDSESLASILETSGAEEYTSTDELELAMLNGVSREAVGRPRYSDRGDEVDEEYNRMDQSF